MLVTVTDKVYYTYLPRTYQELIKQFDNELTEYYPLPNNLNSCSTWIEKEQLCQKMKIVI